MQQLSCWTRLHSLQTAHAPEHAWGYRQCRHVRCNSWQNCNLWRCRKLHQPPSEPAWRCHQHGGLHHGWVPANVWLHSIQQLKLQFAPQIAACYSLACSKGQPEQACLTHFGHAVRSCDIEQVHTGATSQPPAMRMSSRLARLMVPRKCGGSAVWPSPAPLPTAWCSRMGRRSWSGEPGAAHRKWCMPLSAPVLEHDRILRQSDSHLPGAEAANRLSAGMLECS